MDPRTNGRVSGYEKSFEPSQCVIVVLADEIMEMAFLT